MDKVTLKITTGAYAQPYFCEGGRLEDDRQLVYEWIEDNEPNAFYINVPNIFVRNLEISYKVEENPDLANNRFIISET